MINLFHKGKPRKNLIVAAIITSIIVGLSQCTGVSKNAIWRLLDEIQRKYFPQVDINELILKDPEKLDGRIKSDVDSAINKYWRESGLKPAEVLKPIYIESNIDTNVCYTKECQSLGGEIRLCAPWVEGCTLAKEEE